MASKSKGGEIVKLQSTESSHFYSIKLRKGSPLTELKRFDPILRKHVRYVKKKLK